MMASGQLPRRCRCTLLHTRPYPRSTPKHPVASADTSASSRTAQPCLIRGCTSVESTRKDHARSTVLPEIRISHWHAPDRCRGSALLAARSSRQNHPIHRQQFVASPFRDASNIGPSRRCDETPTTEDSAAIYHWTAPPSARRSAARQRHDATERHPSFVKIHHIYVSLAQKLSDLPPSLPKKAFIVSMLQTASKPLPPQAETVTIASQAGPADFFPGLLLKLGSTLRGWFGTVSAKFLSTACSRSFNAGVPPGRSSSSSPSQPRPLK